MTDEPNKSKGITDDAVSSVTEVGTTLIKGIAPADRGWILGFIVVVFFILAADVLSTYWLTVSTSERNVRLTEYLIEIESNRSQAMERQAQTYGDQLRRSQEVIEDLSQAIARQSEQAAFTTRPRPRANEGDLP
jgi:hypothetical protein